MRRRHRKRPQYRWTHHSIPQILAWADDHKRRTGEWPRLSSGRIPFTDENWNAINAALGQGVRGLPGGSSLAQILWEHRGVRSLRHRPPLDPTTIVEWARAHHARTGAWPNLDSGPVFESPAETWSAIDQALRLGKHGLPGGSTLSCLLAENGIKLNIRKLPPLDPEKVMVWADAYFARHGRWPSPGSGAVEEAPLESWSGINTAFRMATRGIRTRSSLARFLNARRNSFRGKARQPKNIKPSERLTIKMIVGWAMAYHKRHGRWPNRRAGRVANGGRPKLKWSAVDTALQEGLRGLPGGSSLARLFKDFPK